MKKIKLVQKALALFFLGYTLCFLACILDYTINKKLKKQKPLTDKTLMRYAVFYEQRFKSWQTTEQQFLKLRALLLRKNNHL